MRPKVERLSEHAKLRARARGVKPGIIALMKDGRALIVNGLNGERYHVLRKDMKAWYVGVESEGVLVTVVTTKDVESYLSKRSNDKSAVKAAARMVIKDRGGKYKGRPLSKEAKRARGVKKMLAKLGYTDTAQGKEVS